MGNNAFGNVKNPFQTPTKRVLCVCSAGLLRSPTMANVLHQTYGYNTRACGIETEFALVPISPVLLFWADEIVAAQKHHITEIQKMMDLWEIKVPVICLDIPDKYRWNDAILRGLILKSYKEQTSKETPNDPSC